MCGKFTQMASWRQVVEFSQLISIAPDAVFTATPMRTAWVIRLNADGKRETVPMRWGLTDNRPGARAIPRHMHARCETVDRLPTFADSFANRRGILLVDTFNEGEEVNVRYDDGEPAGRTWTRQWVITPKDGAPLAMAVIFEDGSAEGGAAPAFVQITTPANSLISRITDRMPAFLQPEDWETWLGETPASLADVKALLRTRDDGGAWDMSVETPDRKPPRPRNPKPKQSSLF